MKNGIIADSRAANTRNKLKRVSTKRDRQATKKVIQSNLKK